MLVTTPHAEIRGLHAVAPRNVPGDAGSRRLRPSPRSESVTASGLCNTFPILSDVLNEASKNVISEEYETIVKTLGYTYLRCPEIARRLDKSDGAIRTMLSRILNLLRNIYTNSEKETSNG